MRKSPIANKLNERERGIVALGLAVLRQHSSRPDAVRSVVHTLRNVAMQDDTACQERSSSPTIPVIGLTDTVVEPAAA